MKVNVITDALPRNRPRLACFAYQPPTALSLSLSLALASHLTRKQQGKDPIAIIALAIPPRQSVYFLLHLASALTLTLLVKRPAVDRYAAG